MRSWLPADTDPRIVAAIDAALADVGEHEVPLGSNRGAWVDAVNRATGSPPGSAWCANALTRWWRAGGLPVPPREQGACETWRQWAVQTGRFSSHPVPGAAVLYGTRPDHASHCGLLICADPLLTIEGNTTLDGYSRNGDIVTLKVLRTGHLLGYVHPLP